MHICFYCIIFEVFQGSFLNTLITDIILHSNGRQSLFVKEVSLNTGYASKE